MADGAPAGEPGVMSVVGSTRSAPGGVESEANRARALLATITSLAARLRAVEWWRVPQDDLLDLARGVEAAVRSLGGVGVRLAGELVERGTADMLGARSPAALLGETLTIPPSQARGRVRLAAATLPGETPTGEHMEAALPEVLDALDAGLVSEDQAVLIVDTVAAIPARVDEATRESCREILLGQARLGDVVRLRRVAEQVRHIVDPDGTLDGRDPTDRAELHIGRARRDGLTPIRGLLDALTTEVLRQAVEPLAAPRSVDDTTPDPRPASVRRAQALAEVLARYLVVGAGPIDGGHRPQVVVTMTVEQLTGGLGSAWADYTGPIPASMARMLACDARIIPQVLGSDSIVLDQGRAARLFPAAIRRAITSRDRGCSFPGCDIPAAWCEAHHIRWWVRDLGSTSERNGCLLCRRHHSLIHHGGWEIGITEEGRPEYIPPPRIDPSRTPRINQHWILPSLAA